jgi:hypothetical protein
MESSPIHFCSCLSAISAPMNDSLKTIGLCGLGASRSLGNQRDFVNNFEIKREWDTFPGDRDLRVQIFDGTLLGRGLGALSDDVVLGFFRAGPDMHVLAIVPDRHRGACRLLP